jgi:hypothetical protein
LDAEKDAQVVEFQDCEPFPPHINLSVSTGGPGSHNQRRRGLRIDRNSGVRKRTPQFALEQRNTAGVAASTP